MDRQIEELLELGGAAETAVAADDHQAVELELLEGLADRLVTLLGGELGVTEGAQDRAAELEDAGDRARSHDHGVSLGQTFPAALDADDFSGTVPGRAHHGPHRSIHTGGIAAPGQHPNPLHETPPVSSRSCSVEVAARRRCQAAIRSSRCCNSVSKPLAEGR